MPLPPDPFDPGSPGPENGGFGLLERAVAYTLGSLQLVTVAALGAPSPCRGWDLRSLLAHLDDSLAALQEAAELGAVQLPPAVAGARWRLPTLEPASGRAPASVVALRLRSASLLGAWAGTRGSETVTVGDGRVPSRMLASAGALEVAVHGWDIAQACGAPRPLPDALATELWGCSGVLVSDADRPARFGAPLPVGVRALPAERLLAYLGRSQAGAAA